MTKVEKIYKKFLGRHAVSEFDINLNDMSELALLGKVHSIEYLSKKHDDKKQVLYRHTFKKKPMLLTNGKEIIIFGDFKINERGIV